MTAVRIRGVTLVELMIYIACLVMFLNIITRLYLSGTEVSRRAMYATVASREGSIILDQFASDIRQSLAVRLSGNVDGAEKVQWRVLIRRSDGFDILYSVSGGKLMRYRAPAGLEPESIQVFEDVESRQLSARVAGFEVKKVEGAEKVYSLSLILLPGKDVESGSGEIELRYHFQTAAASRLEVSE